MIKSDQSLPADEKDMPERVNGFQKELAPLLGKFELGIGARPFIMDDGRVTAQVYFFSDRKKPEAEKIITA